MYLIHTDLQKCRVVLYVLIKIISKYSNKLVKYITNKHFFIRYHSKSLGKRADSTALIEFRHSFIRK